MRFDLATIPCETTRAKRERNESSKMTGPTITSVKGREILDSRGRPSVECELTWTKGENAGGKVLALVPSGKSTGDAEAKELRDGDKSRFAGMGCLKAVKNINEVIGPALVGKCPTQQKEIDAVLLALDASPNKDKAEIGANAILAASMACCRAGAEALGIPLVSPPSLSFFLTLTDSDSLSLSFLSASTSTSSPARPWEGSQ